MFLSCNNNPERVFKGVVDSSKNFDEIHRGSKRIFFTSLKESNKHVKTFKYFYNKELGLNLKVFLVIFIICRRERSLPSIFLRERMIHQYQYNCGYFCQARGFKMNYILLNGKYM